MKTQTDTKQKIKFYKEILKGYENNLNNRFKAARIEVLKENQDIVNKIEDFKKRIEDLKKRNEDLKKLKMIMRT